MSRIDWQPLAVNDISESALRAQQMAGQTFQNAFSSLNGVLGQWEGAQRDREMGELLARQESFVGKDSALYDVARARGELTQGFRYIKPEALATAVRSFGTELERDYRGDLAFADGRVDRQYTLDERGVALADRASGVTIARGREAIKADLAAGRITEAQATERATALAAMTNNAGQITSAYGAVDDGIQSNRGNTRFAWETEGQGRTRTQWNWQVQDRDTEEQASALALKFQEFGPNATNDDLIASSEYQKMPPRVRARALALLGRDAPPADLSAGAPAGGGDGSWTVASGMAASESGGNFGVVNGEGYGGRNQFGAARLADAAAAGLVPRGTTGAQFARMAPDVQRRVEDWHWNDIDKQAESRGLTRYIGQTIGGVQITAGAIRGMAQIGGIGGAQRFLQTGGRYNPADSNGTKISDYGARFSRVPVTPANANAQAQTLQVGASVAAGTDRFGSLARNVIPLMNDDRDNITVAREQTGEGGKFAGLNVRDVEMRIRAVQDMHRQAGGGRLSAASAAQILANNVDPYSLGDFLGGFVGRRGSIGRGVLPDRSININGIREDLAQLRPQPVRGADGQPVRVNGQIQTEIPLATHYRNQSNREGVIAQAGQGAAVVAAAKAALDRQVLIDRNRNITNSPITARLRRDYAAAQEQWGAYVPGAVDQLTGAGQFEAPAPPQPVARGAVGDVAPVRPRTVVYGD